MAEDEDRSEAFLATEKYVDNKTEGKYTLPEGGIPKTDLSPEVQTSLEKANTAAQKSTTLSGYGITDAHITNGVITLGENSITPLSAQVLSSYINGGSYDPTQQKILLKHDSTTVAEIDATAFIKDGMVSSAVIKDGNLVISFNTDAEQQPISVPLASIFNPNNYYDIEAADRKFATKEELAKKRDLSDREFVYHHAGDWDFSPWQVIIPGEYKVEIVDNPVNSALVNFRATSADEWVYCGDGSLNQDGTELTISTQVADFMPLIGTPIVKADVNDSLALTSEMSRKADKAVPTAAGNFAGLDENGNLTDSRYAPGDFATTDALTTKINSVAIAPDFNATSPYAVGKHVTSEGLYYECKVVVPQPEAGTTNPLPKDDIWDAEHTTNHWIMVDVESMLRDILIPVTWQELVDLRTAGDLVPGAQYRITDYVATTNGNMSSQSANHPFDIIVTADDERTLNEKARAIPHAGDTYFTTAGANLAAWEVWYCLDNDTNRFAWALAEGATDSQAGTTGRGVVYRLIDEWRNDVPYDFKGIQFLAYGDNDNVYRYTFDSGAASGNIDFSLDGRNNCVFSNTIKQYIEIETVHRGNRLNGNVFKGGYCYSNTFGTGSHLNIFGGNCTSSTFGDYCHSNIFGDNCTSSTFGDYCSANTFGDNCQTNTFGDLCQSNTFGNGCYSNIFGDNCYSNAFGYGCYSNTFGYGCNSNAFGNVCHSNTFGNGCSANTFGNDCSSSTFGDYCSANTFGDNCSSNTFGNDCYSNTFGDNFSSNTFGDYCSSNTFGNDCNSNTFGNYCSANTFGNDCSSNTFGVFSKGNTFGHAWRLFNTATQYAVGDYVKRSDIFYKCTVAHQGAWNASHFTEESPALSYYRYITLESGVKYIALDCTETRGRGVYYQNVTVAKGVLGTPAAPKRIEDSRYSQDYKTTYQPEDSRVINI